MDWLAFVASIVDSLAWPLGILAIIALLKKPLSLLIPFTKRLKYGDFEWEFQRGLDAAKEEAAAVPQIEAGPLERTPTLPPSQYVQRIRKLARTSPRAAVLEAWMDVEAAARSAAERLQLPKRAGSQPPAAVIRSLRDAPEVNDVVPLLEDLRVLRNQAAHAPDMALTEESALEYAILSERAVAALRAV